MFFIGSAGKRSTVKHERQHTSNCCIVKKEFSDENPYMKIAPPQYTALTPATMIIKQSYNKIKYTHSLEHSNVLTKSEYAHETHSASSPHGTAHSLIRSENTLHQYIGQNRNLESKSFPSSANSYSIGHGDQLASYKELTKRKPGSKHSNTFQLQIMGKFFMGVFLLVIKSMVNTTVLKWIHSKWTFQSWWRKSGTRWLPDGQEWVWLLEQVQPKHFLLQDRTNIFDRR